MAIQSVRSASIAQPAAANATAEEAQKFITSRSFDQVRTAKSHIPERNLTPKMMEAVEDYTDHDVRPTAHRVMLLDGSAAYALAVDDKRNRYAAVHIFDLNGNYLDGGCAFNDGRYNRKLELLPID
jgi:hypothetical protein